MVSFCESGIKKMLVACDEIGLSVSFEGAHAPRCLSSLTIEGVTIDKMTDWDASDYENLTDCICAWSEYPQKQFIKELREFACVGWLDLFGSYAKDSYQDALYSLKDLLKLAMNECAYAVDKWQDVADKRASHEYKSTESAFIYKGYYITPCILKHALNSVIKNIKNNDMIKFYALYYGGCKVKNDVIVEDCLKDLFVNDSNERLTMLDELSGHALININQVRSARG